MTRIKHKLPPFNFLRIIRPFICVPPEAVCPVISIFVVQQFFISVRLVFTIPHSPDSFYKNSKQQTIQPLKWLLEDQKGKFPMDEIWMGHLKKVFAGYLGFVLLKAPSGAGAGCSHGCLQSRSLVARLNGVSLRVTNKNKIQWGKESPNNCRQAHNGRTSEQTKWRKTKLRRTKIHTREKV